MAALIAILFIGTDDPANDLKKAEGSWTAISWEFEGKSFPADSRRLEVRGDKFIWHFGSNILSTLVTHLESAKEPKELDLTRGEGDKQQTILGIYKLQGDTLTICTSSRGERPKVFSSKPGSRCLLRVLKRDKPKPRLSREGPTDIPSPASRTC
jgi:uncharacterized protein (TIGR03067 family)